MKEYVNIEFMIDGVNVIVKSEDAFHILTEGGDRELICYIKDRIVTEYPEAYEILMNWYKRAMTNKTFFDFLIVRRFIKCNFMRQDMTSIDIDRLGDWHIEEPICPIAGECKGYGVVCWCKASSSLSERERVVINMYVDGKSEKEIDKILFISPRTVHNHITNSYKKMGVKDKAAALKYMQNH